MKKASILMTGVALVGFVLAGCASAATGTLEGTASACNGIYPVNGQNPQNVGPVRLEVIVISGSTTVATQQLKGTLANSFRPSYRLTVPPGTYRVVANPEDKLSWPLQARRLQVKSDVTTLWDFGCRGDQ